MPTTFSQGSRSATTLGFEPKRLSAFITATRLKTRATRAELFPEGRRPARTIYQAAALPFGGRVKVMGVAIKERIAG